MGSKETAGALYSIGRFALLSRMSATTLRFYDAQGILKPTAVDDKTGYRYYTADQLPFARSLHRLRQAQLPLDALREFTYAPTEECVRRLHGEQLQQLRHDLDDLNARLRVLERRLAYPWHEQAYQVTVERHSSAPFVFLPHRVTLAHIETAREQAFEHVQAHLARHDVQPASPPVCFFPPRPTDSAEQRRHDLEKIRTVYAGFEVNEIVPSHGRILAGFTPGGTWYVTRHRGLHDYLGCMGPMDYFMSERLRTDGVELRRGHGDFLVAEVYTRGPWDTDELGTLETTVRWLIRGETAGSLRQNESVPILTWDKQRGFVVGS
ncbi:MerR family transcriptional regulator [Deinococcus yavapaiensis]|uniref:DNA-binding transcriptional MerR regulator n=1 Tax=Deinococcus yavapaiensis KR-236 TaxID=694435 RepID=A0A318SRB1_9DEIO|nr:MerR family transcriptional regulator [Deinococcus yavapaiensis]PYE55463.1 DNA-binding transcriptional MerR regulator [Deinococcus yavapaiensis KR-236]